MDSVKQKKILIIGPTKGAVHVKSFYFLVRDYFKDAFVICNDPIDFCTHKVLNFSIKNPINFFRVIKQIRQILAEYQPDVVHVHQANTLALMAIRANNYVRPLILTCWGSDVLIVPQRSFILKKVVQYCLKRATVLTADASYMKDAIFSLSNRRDVVLVNFGIEYTNIEIPTKENIIYSNRLHKPLYRIDKIIIAFSQFVKQHPDWVLVIGATGESTEQLKELAQKKLSAGQYRFIGFVDAKTNQEYYLKSKIWVSFPTSDGTAISLLEAMGYGCIPVVANLPANAEWIENGKNGIISDDLNSAFEETFKLNLSEVQQKNKEIVLQKATKQVNQQIFYAIYNNL